MKRKFPIIAGALLALFTSCNNSSEPSATATDSAAAVPDTITKVVTDTVTKVVEVPATIDSAAITAEFLAAQQKSTKKANPGKPKKQGDKEVNVYSEEVLPSHEAIEASVVTPAKATPTQVILIRENVYFAPAEKAKFPGGMEALTAFVKKNVQYPETALKFMVEGTVFAEVYLDSLGNVTKVDVPGKHLGSGLEEESARVLMKTPRWVPARENGKRVNSKVTVPVTFRIKH